MRFIHPLPLFFPIEIQLEIGEDMRFPGWLLFWTSVWVILLVGSLIGMIYGFLQSKADQSAYKETLCPVVSCTVSDYTCSRFISRYVREQYPCFQIVTTIQSPDRILNYTFTRFVATSWNCTVEYPSYSCYVGNNEIIMSTYGVGERWIILFAIMFIPAIVGLIVFGINVYYWSKYTQNIHLVQMLDVEQGFR